LYFKLPGFFVLFYTLLPVAINKTIYTF